jgi:predicted enzyme involved in methoxymalonyl-ACP biosynthesis
VTCVAVATVEGDTARLLPFVLSCRVFGYGIERAVLNALRRWASAAGAQRLQGRYVSNAYNQPCARFLPENGFAPVDDGWVCDLAQPLPAEAD